MEVRAGLIGAGYIASWHAAAIGRLDGVKLTAVCDADGGRAQKLAEPLGAASFSSIQDLLDSNSCDVVHILLPPLMHANCALQAIGSNKNVFLEKPMCLSSSDCRQIIDAAKSRNLTVGVNHNFLCLPSVDKLSQSIRQKELGDIDHLTVDWMVPLGLAAPGAANSWLTSNHYNAFLEVASHPLGFLAYLLDEPKSFAVNVGNRIDYPNGRSVFARWQIVGETARGTGFTVRVSMSDGYAQRKVEVRGFGGRATLSYDRDIFTLERQSQHDIIVEPFLAARDFASQIKRQAWSNLRTQAASLDKLSPFGLSLTRSIGAFYSTINTQPDSRISAELGCKVVQLAERCIAASAIGTTNDEVATSVEGTIASLEEVAASSQSISLAFAEPAIKGTVLVFGGTGFIGQHLVRQLVADGYKVAVVSRRSCPELDGYKDRVKVLVGSVSDSDFLEAAVQGADYVHHLARPSEARSWNDYVTGDIDMTRLIGEACCKPNIRRFVYTGTIDSYFSGGNDLICEATGLDPQISNRNLYARSKAKCEDVLKELHLHRQLPLVIARPGIVLGRGGSPLHPGVGMWLSPTTCLLWGHGVNKLPFVLVEDVATALINMLESPNAVGEDYNLVGDPLLDARQYIASYEAALHCRVQTYQRAIWRYFMWDCLKNLIKIIARPSDARMPSYRDWKSRSYSARYDNTKAKGQLNWRPAQGVDTLVALGIDAPVQQLYHTSRSGVSTMNGCQAEVQPGS